MKSKPAGRLCMLLSLVMLMLGAQDAVAGILTFDLTCVFNGLNVHPCVSGPSFGTVTLKDPADDGGLAAGQISVAVDLGGTGQKFRDLMLNFSGSAASISSSDGQVTLSPNGFNIDPYNGLFDVGSTGQKGWEGPDLYYTILSGNTALSLTDFSGLDTLSKLGVALHIQNIGDSSGGDCDGNDDGTTDCVPVMTGAGSLKIGGLQGGGGTILDAPEPATSALLGAGLLALALLYRRKRA